MGMGSLRRIAALSLLATFAVFAMGAMSVPALTVPGTTVNVPSTPVTVTAPTLRVPSTATTPPPAPKVTVPKAPSAPPAVKPVAKPVTKPVTNVVKQAVPKATGTVTKTVPKATGTVQKVAPKTTNTIKKATGDTTKTITNTGSPAKSGRPSGPSGPVDTLLGNLTGSLGGTTRTATGTVSNSSGLATSGAGSSTGSGSVVNGSNGMTFLGGSGGGPGGGSGGMFGGGSSGGGGFPGGSAATGGGGSLAAMLVGASPKQLRNVLAHLEGCLPALPAIDRQVISMRAGVNGTPLTRPQIGARLGMSRQTVRQTERRALNRLQYAAANTGCAGTLVGPFDASGIGNLTPQLLFAGAVPVNGSSAELTSGSDGFAQARGILPRTVDPLFDIGGNGQSGPAWAIILFTILFSAAIAALTRELRSSF